MSDAMRFSPARIRVRAGETIRFQVHNTGRLRHEMVLGTRQELAAHAALMRRFPDMQHADPNMLSLEPGHMEAGMLGALEVVRRWISVPACWRAGRGHSPAPLRAA
ncbi:hypothetical protein [Niveibacterium sp. SC-1]|uniref:hypothetical protein n=1 Tax=Niveibacterium sp. SC-1 TaxID=3135646 RepID=UPI00311E731E